MGNILKSVFKKIVREDSFLYQWVYSRYKFGLFAPGITRQPGSIITRYNNQKKGDLFFVQIGANDGKSGDPLYEFIINHNWKGILVEPMPDVFEQLKENFSFASGRLIFENSAISDTGGEFTLYYIDNSEKKFPEWVSQLTSFNKDVLQKNLTYYPEYARHISEKKIQSLSFSALLKKHGVTTVDLVSIDTEGFDYEILKTIDFGVTRPSLIIFEVSHLSKEQFKKGVSLLKKHNYAVAITAKDCIAYSKVPGPGQTTG